MRHLAPLILLALSIVACQAAPVPKSTLWGQLQANPLQVDALENAEPSKLGPLRVGLAPPVRPIGEPGRRHYGHPLGYFGYDVWTDEERELIERFATQLKRSGHITQLVILPSLLVDEGTDSTSATVDITAMQRAARRRQLDAVVVVRGADSYGQRNTPLALLDVTIVGAFLVPGHRYEGNAVLEAVAVDAHTGYVYASASADGDHSRMTPIALAERQDVLQPARLEALEELGERLTSELREM